MRFAPLVDKKMSLLYEHALCTDNIVVREQFVKGSRLLLVIEAVNRNADDARCSRMFADKTNNTRHRAEHVRGKQNNPRECPGCDVRIRSLLQFGVAP